MYNHSKQHLFSYSKTIPETIPNVEEMATEPAPVLKNYV